MITALIDRINDTLNRILPSHPSNRLQQAMHYSVFNGGKRLRPLWVYITGQTFGAALETLDMPAAAIECIHCYSLIHDDLPAMDDDDLRRGKPTCHKAFDEATAILAGDALQTLAFDILSKADCPAQMRIQMVSTLAEQSGYRGMVGGQSLDLLAENKTIAFSELQHIHALKTGALIRASIRLGALAANCDENTLQTLDHFAKHAGLAFQIQDDLLDIESTTDKLGKTAGSDIKLQKSTYPALLGIEKAKQQLNEAHQAAICTLNKLSQDTHQIAQFFELVMQRSS